jgi:VWFA-related protein
VYVLFSASSHGKFVSDLGAEDISVLDDGLAPEKMLAFYGQRNLPLRMGLLIDTSPSVYSRFAFEQDAAREFLTHVVRSDSDKAFVMGFADYPQLTRTFTSSPAELWPAVASLVNQGNSTALFDAVVEGCRKLSNHAEHQFVARTLVVVSDGEENSSLATLYRTVLAAQEFDVTIYTISTRTPWHHRDSADGDRILKTLAEETGGRALFPESPRKFRSAFAHVAEELHSRYAISYRPAHFVLDDHYRRIQINAERSGKKLKVHGRKGYYATAHTDDIAQRK